MIAGLSNKRLLFVQNPSSKVMGIIKALRIIIIRGFNLWLMSLTKVSIS